MYEGKKPINEERGRPLARLINEKNLIKKDFLPIIDINKFYCSYKRKVMKEADQPG